MYYCVKKVIETKLSRSLKLMKKSKMTNDVNVSTSKLIFQECLFIFKNLKFAEYAELIKL